MYVSARVCGRKCICVCFCARACMYAHVHLWIRVVECACVWLCVHVVVHACMFRTELVLSLHAYLLVLPAQCPPVQAIRKQHVAWGAPAPPLQQPSHSAAAPAAVCASAAATATAALCCCYCCCCCCCCYCCCARLCWAAGAGVRLLGHIQARLPHPAPEHPERLVPGSAPHGAPPWLLAPGPVPSSHVSMHACVVPTLPPAQQPACWHASILECPCVSSCCTPQPTASTCLDLQPHMHICRRTRECKEQSACTHACSLHLPQTQGSAARLPFPPYNMGPIAIGARQQHKQHSDAK